MEFLIVMASLVVLGLAVAGFGRLLRPRRKTRAFPVLPTPTFKVVALGNSGSGKTVLLASLFYQFRARPGRPYYFDTDPATRVRLGGLLSDVVDPGQAWPGATSRGGTRAYTFTCMAQTDGEPTPAFTIEYLDYAGEIFELTGESNAPLEELFTRVQGADALIGMLDGRRVLQFLRGEAGGRAYMIAKIAVMVQLMARARCAIYLVISKWDLVHDFGEPERCDDRGRLEAVVQALMTVDHISDLVRSRSQVRLIPISSVGPAFAAVDDRTGLVNKLPDGTFAPFNVEVPIAAIVPDLFARVRDSMNEQTVSVIQDEYRVRRRHTPEETLSEVGSFLLRPAGLALRASLDAVLNRPYSNEVVGMMLQWMAQPGRRREAELAAFRDEAQRQAYRVWDARTVVLDDFQKLVHRLEIELPASVLSR